MVSQRIDPVVLLTGASSGIGEALARTLTAHLYRVFGTSRKPQPAGDWPFLTMDLQDPTSVDQAGVALKRFAPHRAFEYIFKGMYDL